MNDIIIGGGISGLIAAFYNKDYTLISKDVGGQMANNYLGPRILEKSKSSEKFLKDLGIKAELKRANIGFQIGDKILPEASKEDRAKYYIKSRCLRDIDIIPSSIMSDGKNYIDYFNVDWNEVVKKILADINDRVIKENVSNINLDNKTIKIGNSGEADYKSIISTIPAPIFYQIVNKPSDKQFKYIPKLFAIIDLDAASFFCNLYDYIYYITDFKFHRVTKIEADLAVEYTTEENFDDILSEWNGLLKASYKLKYGQIISGEVDKIDDVIFLGRYAEWNHDIKINDVLDRFIKGE